MSKEMEKPGVRMTSWIPLSRTDHALKHWQPRKGFEFAADRQIVPVIIAELSKVLPHYVTGFVKTDDNNYQFVALIGVGGDRNLYITHDSQWLCGYVPATLRAYPFALLNDREGTKVFCMEEAFITDDANFPRIFKDDGALETEAAETLEFVTQCERNRLLTEKACIALGKAELIKPWPISIDRGEGKEPLHINGMYKIDESTLESLDASSLSALHDAGALPLAYAQLFSIAQLEQLAIRADYLAKETIKPKAGSGLESLFDNEDAGSLNFDALDLGGDNN